MGARLFSFARASGSNRSSSSRSTPSQSGTVTRGSRSPRGGRRPDAMTPCIRPALARDVDAVVDIWLEGSAASLGYRPERPYRDDFAQRIASQDETFRLFVAEPEGGARSWAGS